MNLILKRFSALKKIKDIGGYSYGYSTISKGLDSIKGAATTINTEGPGVLTTDFIRKSIKRPLTMIATTAAGLKVPLPGASEAAYMLAQKVEAPFARKLGYKKYLNKLSRKYVKNVAPKVESAVNFAFNTVKQIPLLQ